MIMQSSCALRALPSRPVWLLTDDLNCRLDHMQPKYVRQTIVNGACLAFGIRKCFVFMDPSTVKIWEQALNSQLNHTSPFLI